MNQAKEGKKWKKWTKEFSDDTKDISKLPEKKKKKQKELNEFMGPEEYIVQLSLPAIDDMHASQLIKDCMVNGCPDKLDNISLISSTLR